MTKIIIIGAGIGGLTTAIALRKFRPDIAIEIYERSDELRPVGAGLTLAANAMLGFHQLGIQQQVIRKSRVLEKFQVRDKQGRLITETDNISLNKDFNVISNFSVHRADLQQVLLEELDGVPLHLGKKVESFVTAEQGVEIIFSDKTTLKTDYVIATDGIHSVFRWQLVPNSVTRYAGYTCWRGITQKLPAHFNATTATETWALGKRFGMVPLANERVYWFACINAKQAKDETFAAYGKEELLQSFGGFHAPVEELIGLTATEDILWSDIIDFVPLKQFAFGNVLLLGDAAHATTPNMGQGACQAIEGAVILGKTLEKMADIKEAFLLFEQKRLKRTAFIVNRSWQIGKLAQTANPVVAFLRNSLFKLIPAKASRRQVAKILEVDFG